MDAVWGDVKPGEHSQKDFDRTARRLQRIDFARPDSIAAAHRRHEGYFWGPLTMTRHAHRMRLAVKCPELLPLEIYKALLFVPRADAILTEYGELWSLDPDGLELNGPERWPAHIQWGSDRLVDVARHLRAGRTVAALATTRHQLERWTLNVAHHHRIEPLEGERTPEFFSRVWSVYPQIEIDLGAAWAELSEWLHGRGSLTSLWECEAGRMNRHSLPVDQATLALHLRIAQVATAVFGQVRGCVAELARSDGRGDWVRLMQSSFDIQMASDLPDALNTAIKPLDPPMAYGRWADVHLAGAPIYRAEARRAAQANRVEPLTDGRALAGAVFERRVRAIQRFRFAWEDEKKELGSEFEPGRLGARLFRYIAISETAEMLGPFANGEPERRHLQLAGAALRSAWNLWLEDTHLSLPCIRTLLEQTCAARTWRLKPSRAERVETARGRAASPSRWIEGSGWKRGALLGQALGEFSHVSLRSRWPGALDLLTQIQQEDEVSPVRTARGHALDAAAYLLALELSERLFEIDDDLARGFGLEVTLLDDEEHGKMIDSILGRVAALTGFDFGEPLFGVDEDLPDVGSVEG